MRLFFTRGLEMNRKNQNKIGCQSFALQLRFGVFIQTGVVFLGTSEYMRSFEVVYSILLLSK